MTYRNELSVLLKDLDVAYIPIFSMFDHRTKLVDLECDGNVNRWMTNFYKSGQTWKKMIVFGPSRDLAKSAENFNTFRDKLDSNFKRLEYVESPAFADGTKKQRSSEFSTEILSKFKDKLLGSDVIIAESQPLVKALAELRNVGEWSGKLIYWCPVCATSDKSRSFLETTRDIDTICFNAADHIIVATAEQAEYIHYECGITTAAITILGEFIDRTLPMFCNYTVDTETLKMVNYELDLVPACIYLPFRLSDEGYKIWEILDSAFIKLMSNELTIFSPNVNGSSEDEIVKLCKDNGCWLGENQIRDALKRIKPISSSRDTYYTLLDHCTDLIIPYFEDWKFVMHAAVDELICGSKKPVCTVLQTKAELDALLASTTKLAQALERVDLKKDVMDRVFKSMTNSRSFRRLVLKYSAREKLPSFVFSGVGKNWYICEKVVKTFISMGIQAQALDPNHALHGDLGMLKADGEKVLVFVSRSGTTAELVKFAKVVRALKDRGILTQLETVALFLNHTKPNAELFDTWIFPNDPANLSTIYEFDERDLVPSLSINILQMILDLLGVLLYEGHPELVAGYVYNHLSGGNGEKLGGAAILNDIH